MVGKKRGEEAITVFNTSNLSFLTVSKLYYSSLVSNNIVLCMIHTQAITVIIRHGTSKH